jgi:hypothetical protein
VKNNKQPRRASRIIAKLSLIAFGLLCGALMGEIALRIAGYSYPEFYQPDQSRGYSLRPNMEGRYRKEGDALVRINSDGLRDREHAIAKPAGTIRIAVIGDSYPEAFPVPMADAFWSIVEKKLTECGAFGGKPVEVINFGVSGYGTAQELITLREHVWQYAPDIVMLTVTTNNDISDNLRALKKTDEVPYFVYREGKLILDDSFRETRGFRLRQSMPNRIGRWIKDHSRLIQAINQGHHGFKIWLASRRAPHVPTTQPGTESETKNAAAASEELGIDNVVYREPGDQVWNEAWQVTEGLIRQIRDEVTARGARFVVVTLSNGIQVYPDPNVRQLFLKRVGASDLFYPDNRIKSLCDREKIPVITLAPHMRDYADQNKVFLHGFGANVGNGHWNQLGHRVAAELIAKRLCETAELSRLDRGLVRCRKEGHKCPI